MKRLVDRPPVPRHRPPEAPGPAEEVQARRAASARRAEVVPEEAQALVHVPRVAAEALELRPPHPARTIPSAATAGANRRAVEAGAKRMERIAEACVDPVAAEILRRAAARARTTRTLSVLPAPRAVVAKRPELIAGVLERTLRGTDDRQRVHLLFRPDDPDVAPFTVPQDVVRGLPSGAPCAVRMSRGELGEAYFEVKAPPEAFVKSILADVVLHHGRPYARGRGMLAPYDLVPLSSGRGEELEGQAIIAEIHNPASDKRSASILEVLGRASGPKATFLQAATEAGASLEFPQAVLDELEAIKRNDRVSGTDLTHLPFVTIDNEDSKDLDQALCIERRKEGGWTVHYAIADAAHFVRPGGAIDAEARRRALTTYLPDRMLPVLPPELSEQLCSLVAKERRRAFVVSVDLDAQGNAAATRFQRGVIRSRAKLSYPGVSRYLKGAPDPRIKGAVGKSLRLLREVGKKRMELAAQRGVVASAELEARVEREEGAFWLRARKRNDVEHWNEQISLLVNEEVGKFLGASGVKVLHRVHLPPTAEAVASFRARVAALGLPWPEDQSLGDYFQRLDPLDPRTLVVNRLAARINRKATYSTEPLGHAALKLDSYDHFTAPMRRYPDIVVHRVLAALIEGTPVPHQDQAELDGIVASVEAARRRNLEVASRCGEYMLAETLQRRMFTRQKATVVELGPSGALVQLAHEGLLVPMTAGALRGVGAGRAFTVSADGTCLKGQQVELRLGEVLDVSVVWADPASGAVDAVPSAFVRKNR